MANYRSVHVKLWTDPKIEPLSTDARYLFLYLITNEHRNESGLYGLTVRTMANETGLTPKRIEAALDALEKVRRVAYDAAEGIVWVVNAAKHTPLNENCIKSIARDLEFCSSATLRESFCVHYSNHLLLQDVSKRFANGSQTVWDGLPNPSYRVQGTGYKEQGTGNKDKESKSKFVSPTLEEVTAYCTANGFPESLAKKAFEYYSVAEWHDSQGKPVRNWKQKLQAVWFKEENRKPDGGGTDYAKLERMVAEADERKRKIFEKYK